MMKKHSKIIALTLSMMLLLAGCSGDKPAPSKDAKTPLTGGSYTATVKSHGGDMTVQLDCKDNQLTAVKVVSHSDTPEYIEKVLETLPAAIVKEQSLEIEGISGATLSGNAIKAAVAQCIRDAGGNPREYDYVPVSELSAKQEITFEGLKGGDKTYTGEQIKALPMVETNAVSVNASGEETPLTCKGVLLETILTDCGTSQLDYGSIILTASDGYSIEIPAEVLQKRDIIIAYEVNGEACNLRSVVPEERAMYWVKFIDSIALCNPVEKLETTQIVLLETAVKGCTETDYKYYDSMDKAVSVSQLFETYITEKADFVALSAIDGWGKNDKYDTVVMQFIKTTEIGRAHV